MTDNKHTNIYELPSCPCQTVAGYGSGVSGCGSTGYGSGGCGCASSGTGCGGCAGTGCADKQRLSGTVILFSSKDCNNLYELKYNTNKCELVLVITSCANSTITENVIISGHNDARYRSCGPDDLPKPLYDPQKSICDRYKNQCDLSNCYSRQSTYKQFCQCKTNRDPNCKSACCTYTMCVKGEKGCCGAKGEKGSRGRTGLNGLNGVDGADGADGADGVDGVNGAKGQKGDKGRSGCGFRFVGTYNPCKVYYYNDVVRVDSGRDCIGGIYVYTFATPTISMSPHTNICDAPGWELMIKDCVSTCVSTCAPHYANINNHVATFNDKNIIESYNDKNLYNDKNTHCQKSRVKTGIFSDEFETAKQLKNLLNIANAETTGDFQCFNYYAYKQKPIKYSVSNSKKQKWSVPILFEKVQDCGSCYDCRNDHIVFNKTGTYKVTLHINFTGTHVFKTSAYLLKPTDNASANVYMNNRQLLSSKMTLNSASAYVKNHLHYCFVVKVAEPMSTIVIMSKHRNTDNNGNDSDEIIIYGKEKTWILIEKING